MARKKKETVESLLKQILETLREQGNKIDILMSNPTAPLPWSIKHQPWPIHPSYPPTDDTKDPWKRPWDNGYPGSNIMYYCN